MVDRKPQQYRVLVIDDIASIHEDIRKILVGGEHQDTALDDLESELFGDDSASSQASVATVQDQAPTYRVDGALQGQDGLRAVEDALKVGNPYTIAFVDMRMPPGWDGLETIEHLWKADPHLQTVICTAYSDYSRDEIIERLGVSDRLLVLRKPFEPIEIAQMAETLSQKWTLQQQLQANIDVLDAQVAERTRELRASLATLKKQAEERAVLEEELRLAQKLEAVGELSAGIAHEINTPIQYVTDSLGFVEESIGTYREMNTRFEHALNELERAVLSEEAQSVPLKVRECFEKMKKELNEAKDELDIEYVDEEIGETCQRALKGLQRVSEIVSAMRGLSHPGAQEAQPVNIAQLVADTITVTQNVHKHVTDIETSIPNVSGVLGYAGELAQVFMNLIVNAAQAIEESPPPEGGKISIQMREDGPCVRLIVQDNGPGINESIAHRVFDPFFTTKDVGQGTGQGLSLVRRIIVQRHGGKIHFERNEPRGTRFIVELPREQLGVPNTEPNRIDSKEAA